MYRLFFLILFIHFLSNGQNVQLSANSLQDSEPFIAINPYHPNHMVIAWMGYKWGHRVVIRSIYTLDYGASWSSIFEHEHYVSGYTSADPTISFDENGNVLLAFVDYSGQTSLPPTGSVVLTISSDYGATWSLAESLISTSTDSGQLPIDRPWIRVDRAPFSPYRGRYYITTMNAKGALGPNYHPYLYVKDDSGTHFWRYIDTIGYLSGSVIKQPMPSPDVSKSGVLYAVYPSYVFVQNPKTQFILAKSIDGGNTFSYIPFLSDIQPVNEPLSKKAWLLRCNPAYSEHLAFVYLSSQNDISDVFVVESFDGGNTWGNPVQANHSHLQSLEDMVWADFNNNGDLVVVWRDRRNATATSTYQTDFEIWAAVKKSNDTSFANNFLVSDTLLPYHSSMGNSGNDFLGVVYQDDTLNCVWGDTRTGRIQIWFQRMNDYGSVISVQNIANQQPNSIQIFPNPATNQIHIRAKSIKSILVYNYDGKLIQRTELNTPTDFYTFSVAHYDVGTYIVQCRTEYLLIRETIVKK